MVKKPNIRSPLVAPNRNAQKQKKKSGSANNKDLKINITVSQLE